MSSGTTYFSLWKFRRLERWRISYRAAFHYAIFSLLNFLSYTRAFFSKSEHTLLWLVYIFWKKKCLSHIAYFIFEYTLFSLWSNKITHSCLKSLIPFNCQTCCSQSIQTHSWAYQYQHLNNHHIITVLCLNTGCTYLKSTQLSICWKEFINMFKQLL